MALYRQIAGNDVPSDQVGYNIFQAAKDAINPYLMTPVDYSTPIQTIQPSNPINISDTGGTSPIADPREWNPINQYKPPLTTIDLGPSALQPTITPSQPLQPDDQTSTPLPADTKSVITNNILPLLALAAVVVVAVKGDDLLHEKRKVALLGGLGLLYYGMAKNKLV